MRPGVKFFEENGGGLGGCLEHARVSNGLSERAYRELAAGKLQ
jgi:hypothetical protein